MAITGYGVDIVESNLKYFVQTGVKPIDRLIELAPHAVVELEQPRLPQLLPSKFDNLPTRTMDPFDSFRNPGSAPSAVLRSSPTGKSKKSQTKSMDAWRPVKPRSVKESLMAAASPNRRRADSRMNEIPSPEPVVRGPRSGTVSSPYVPQRKPLPTVATAPTPSPQPSPQLTSTTPPPTRPLPQTRGPPPNRASVVNRPAPINRGDLPINLSQCSLPTASVLQSLPRRTRMLPPPPPAFLRPPPPSLSRPPAPQE